MKKLLLAGLAALVIGTSYDARSKKHDYGFIAPEINYSLEHTPSYYGLTQLKHGSSGSSYSDVYSSGDGWVRIDCFDQEGDLQELYDAYSREYLKKVPNFLQTVLGSDKDVYILIRKPKSLDVDGNDALSEEAELKMASGDRLNPVYGPEFTLKMTLSKGHEKTYRFTLFYEHGGTGSVDDFYEDVLDGFQRLK